MKVRQGPARAALLSTLVSVVVVGVTASAASAAATPPYEPDAGAAGSITFYDAAGTAITSGTTSTPVGYAVGSAPLTATGSKASLYGYLPKSGQAPGAFSGELLAGPTTFPIAGAPAAISGSSNPAVQPVAGDLTFADLTHDFPNTATDAYQGLYQIRIKTSDAKYLATDIQISGSTWIQVYPAPSGTATTTTLAVSPAAATPGQTETLTATVGPAAAAGTVQFSDGSTALGAPVAVSGGTATKTVTLAAGAHSLTAAFLPTDSAAYAPSTSAVRSYAVRTATSLTLAKPVSAVIAGQSFRVSGAMKGGAVSGKRVVLYLYGDHQAVKTAALTTSSTGAFSYLIRGVVNTSFRAVFSATATQAAATSNTVRTLVRTAVTITSPKSGTQTRTRTVAITGKIYPNHPGGIVNLYERRGTSYVLIARARVASNSTFRFVRTFARGTHVLQVRIGATSTNAAGNSSLVSLREL
ncbi:MAG: hypothetical protein JWM02_903 [Frankiales bacterium]|nr:hypothetical protein [Frankiales bacterium]